MKRLLTLALVAAMTGSVSAQKQQTLHSGYPIDPVPFTSVKVTDSFWGQRLKASREVTIPLAFSKCEETGRYENFVKATHPSDEYLSLIHICGNRGIKKVWSNLCFVMIYHNGLLLLQIFDYQRSIIVLIQSYTEWHSLYD